MFWAQPFFLFLKVAQRQHLQSGGVPTPLLFSLAFCCSPPWSLPELRLGPLDKLAAGRVTLVNAAHFRMQKNANGWILHASPWQQRHMLQFHDARVARWGNSYSSSRAQPNSPSFCWSSKGKCGTWALMCKGVSKGSSFAYLDTHSRPAGAAAPLLAPLLAPLRSDPRHAPICLAHQAKALIEHFAVFFFFFCLRR